MVVKERREVDRAKAMEAERTKADTIIRVRSIGRIGRMSGSECLIGIFIAQ